MISKPYNPEYVSYGAPSPRPNPFRMSSIKAVAVSTVALSIALSVVVSFAFLKYFPSVRTPVQMPVQSFQTIRTDRPISASDIESDVKDVASRVGASVVSIVVSKDMQTYRTDPFGFFYEPAGTVRRKV